jgi:c-di-GMP-binding flagellar brake protein YcgR
MAPPETPPRVDEPSYQERRRSERFPTILSCPYELTRVSGSDTVELSEGVTLALNISAGGMLLLMPQPLGERKVFEVHVHSPAKSEKTTKLVEVCWTREYSFGAGTKVHLVGVKSLFEHPASNQLPRSA